MVTPTTMSSIPQQIPEEQKTTIKPISSRRVRNLSIEIPVAPTQTSDSGLTHKKVTKSPKTR